MYAIEMRPVFAAAAASQDAAMPALTTMRELTDAELMLVSGAWSWSDFGGSVFAGTIGGAATGLYLGGAHGAGIGAIGGAIGGGFTYIGRQLWDIYTC